MSNVAKKEYISTQISFRRIERVTDKLHMRSVTFRCHGEAPASVALIDCF